MEDKLKNYIVYKHTLPDGKYYIGQTNNIERRWNPVNYKGCSKFYKGILKYGWDNIKHEIIKDNLTKEEANTLEALLIKKTKDLNISYNIHNGNTNKTKNKEVMHLLIEVIPEITNLDGNSIRVLLWCWKLSNFNINLPTGNTISNNQIFRNSIRENGGDLTDSVITKAFHILAKKGLLIKQCKGQYTLNPEYFFKGTLSNRSSLKYTLSYNPE